MTPKGEQKELISWSSIFTVEPHQLTLLGKENLIGIKMVVPDGLK